MLVGISSSFSKYPFWRIYIQIVRSRRKIFIWERSLKRKQKWRGRIQLTSWISVPRTKQNTEKELIEKWLIAFLPHCCAWAGVGRSAFSWASWACEAEASQAQTTHLSLTCRALMLPPVCLAWKVLSMLQVYLPYTWKQWSSPTDGANSIRWCWWKGPSFVRKSLLWSAWICLQTQSSGNKEAFVLLDDREGCAANLILLTSTSSLIEYS